MMKKRFLLILLVLVLAIQPVFAQEEDRTYSFALSVNDADTVEVNRGDIITLTLRLRRTDQEERYAMHAMQAELRYDGTFLELVEDGGTTFSGVTTTDLATADRYRECYMSFLSMSGGTTWEANTLVGTVQFRVIGDSGISFITNEDFLVSLPDGSGSYPCSSNRVMVILSTECTVKFQSNGGSPVSSQTVIFGETVRKPADPIREGYTFQGWYSDIYLTEAWDFDHDTVEKNMTLYAKWEAQPQADTTQPTQGDDTQKPAASFPWWLLLVIVIAVILWFLVRKKKK